MNTGVRGRTEVGPAPLGPPSGPPPPLEPADSDRPMSPGLPPSYAESLQHRTVEYGGYDMFYTGPPPPLPANYHLGPEAPTHIDRVPEEGEEARDATVDEDTERCMKMTLPPMHMCMAVTCLVFNFLIPGSGTMLAAFGVFCCTRRNEWTVKRKFGACCLNFTIGIAQLILTPLLLLGWVWSILWGFAFVGVSSEAYHGRKRTNQQEAGHNPHRPLTATSRPGVGPPPPFESTPGTSRTDTSGPGVPPTESRIQVTPVIHASGGSQSPPPEADTAPHPLAAAEDGTPTTPRAFVPEPEASTSEAPGSSSGGASAAAAGGESAG